MSGRSVAATRAAAVMTAKPLDFELGEVVRFREDPHLRAVVIIPLARPSNKLVKRVAAIFSSINARNRGRDSGSGSGSAGESKRPLPQLDPEQPFYMVAVDRDDWTKHVMHRRAVAEARKAYAGSSGSSSSSSSSTDPLDAWIIADPFEKNGNDQQGSGNSGADTGSAANDSDNSNRGSGSAGEGSSSVVMYVPQELIESNDQYMTEAQWKKVQAVLVQDVQDGGTGSSLATGERLIPPRSNSLDLALAKYSMQFDPLASSLNSQVAYQHEHRAGRAVQQQQGGDRTGSSSSHPHFENGSGSGSKGADYAADYSYAFGYSCSNGNGNGNGNGNELAAAGTAAVSSTDGSRAKIPQPPRPFQPRGMYLTDVAERRFWSESVRPQQEHYDELLKEPRQRQQQQVPTSMHQAKMRAIDKAAFPVVESALLRSLYVINRSLDQARRADTCHVEAAEPSSYAHAAVGLDAEARAGAGAGDEGEGGGGGFGRFSHASAAAGTHCPPAEPLISVQDISHLLRHATPLCNHATPLITLQQSLFTAHSNEYVSSLMDEASSLKGRGHLAAATKTVERALLLDPSFASLHHAMANVKEIDYRGLLTHAVRALQLNPWNHSTWELVGVAVAMREREDRATTELLSRGLNETVELLKKTVEKWKLEQKNANVKEQREGGQGGETSTSSNSNSSSSSSSNSSSSSSSAIRSRRARNAQSDVLVSKKLLALARNTSGIPGLPGPPAILKRDSDNASPANDAESDTDTDTEIAAVGSSPEAEDVAAAEVTGTARSMTALTAFHRALQLNPWHSSSTALHYHATTRPRLMKKNKKGKNGSR